MPHATVRGPDGWVKAKDLVSTSTGVNAPDTASIMELGDITAFGSTASLDEIADTAIDVGHFQRDPRKLPAMELDGEKVYHLAGQIQESTYFEEVGAIFDGRIITLTFRFDDDVRPTARERIVASVLPTFHWK